VNIIRQIMRDQRAAGVVLYVNSRGGSATASESIRIALEKLAAIKPLVVVMGPVAGSGGYWVSIPGATILAQPNTLTGSIGVVLGKIADQGLLQKLYVNLESISRGANVRIYEPEAPFTEGELELVRAFIQRIYELFLARVSDSRGISLKDLDPIAGGRVWTGRQALTKGLVDGLGGLDHAFEKVLEITGLGDQTPLRIYEPGKRNIPPMSEPASILSYGLVNLKTLSGNAMCLCPWLEV
jgi:protease-4